VRFILKLLGSFEASLDDVSVVPSAAKQRQLFALLALNAGRAVSVSMIMDELWGTEQTKAAATTLHTYIGKLRGELGRALGEGNDHEAKQILVTEPVGYSLQMPFADLDVSRYEQLSKAGRLAADRHDFAATSRNLGAALALWRGPALSDVVAGQHLRVEVVRLEENKLTDLDLRLEADLHLGKHRALLGELAGLCEQFPMSESLGTKYMLALFRSGQQWRALEVYQRLRTTMASELGVEPSAGMQRLHLAMLRGDPEVTGPTRLADKWVSAS
jgi:SARP family transcriptional regulator, regulator of embCAB operon